MKPDPRSAMFDELLQFHYGCHEDPSAIEQRLAVDAELRALLDEVRQTAALLDAAARAPAPPLDLTADPLPRRKRRLAIWPTIAAIAACAVAAPFVSALLADRAVQRAIDHDLRLVVTGPPTAPDATPVSYHIETWDADGQPKAADVTWSFQSDTGEVLASATVASTGALDAFVPAGLERSGTFRVAAEQDGTRRTADLVLAGGRSVPLAHLTVDKPVYRPGETVRMRALLLDRQNLAPRPGHYQLRVVDGKGVEVHSYAQMPQDGVIACEYPIPDGAAGGRYALELRDDEDSFTVDRIEFLVRNYQPPRLQKVIALNRQSYAPGDRGVASIGVSRIAGGPAFGASITAELVVDGSVTWTEQAIVDDDGHARLEFAIPAQVSRGEARFVARIADRGVLETEIKPFVIPTGAVTVNFYPEAGDLVDGVPNRVYAEVRDPLDRPISARGRVVDASGQIVASFDTEHQGRARFEFTPTAGVAYQLVLEQPPTPPISLPATRGEVALRAASDAFAPGRPLSLTVHTLRDGPWLLGVFCRGELVANDPFQGAGDHTLAVPLPASVAGVLRVTVFDHAMHPVAERLVQRASDQDLRVTIAPDDAVLSPGQHQRVAVRTTDPSGRPVSAVVGLTVTDRAVRDLVGEVRVGLADQTWLLADVSGDELEDVQDFLTDAAAPRHIDLLLGTRGWRRFAWVDPDAFLAANGDLGKRLLVTEARAQAPRVVDTYLGGPQTEALRHQARQRMRSATRFAALVATILVLGLLALGGAWLGRKLAPRLRIAPPLAAGASVATAVAMLMMLLSTQSRESTVLMAGVEGDPFLAGPDAPPLPLGVGEKTPVKEMVEGDPFLAGSVEGDPFLAGPDAPPLPLGVGEKLEIAMGAAPGFAFDADDPAAAEQHKLDQAPPADRAEVDDERGADKDIRFKNIRGIRALGYVAEQNVQVIEYAHRAVTGPGRSDFAETVYWRPYLRTDAEGTATVEFDVSDSVTTWSVFADAHGDGRIGQGRAEFVARIPFRMEPVLPYELTQGDRVSIPVAVLCDDTDIPTADLKAMPRGGLRALGDLTAKVTFDNGGTRWLIPVAAEHVDPDTYLEISGDARRWGDRVDRAIRIVPRGFPCRESRGGRLGAEPQVLHVNLPDQWQPGSLRASLKVYTSPIAGLKDGMDGMLQQPCGCFEQASSSNYPNLLALSLMEASGGDDPVFQQRARELLDAGYAKITGYECSDKGYEWFGSNPGHEALTAYGLLEFHDMARVYDVDSSMVARTRNWLLSRRDGSGGYQRNERALDTFGRAPAEVTDAYVTSALASTGVATDLTAELDRLEQRGVTSGDPYEMALIASALHAAGRAPAAQRARQRLTAWQRDDGSLVGTTTSITSSRGDNLEVETTALATLAWLDDATQAASVERAVSFLLTRRSADGRFGATQATILALRALTRYAEQSRRSAQDGSLVVLVDDREVERIDFKAGTPGPMVIDRIGAHLKSGDNEIVLRMEGGTDFPFALSVEYFTEQPADDPRGAVSITTQLQQAEVTEGALVPLVVTVRNETDAGVPMTLAVIGLPASLDVDAKVLDDLKEAGRVDLWELRSRELVLYWRGLAPAEVRGVHLDLLARLPGTTTGPASRAYLYYTDDQQRWAEPLTVTVTPR